jgi:antirestriction protein ArdC
MKRDLYAEVSARIVAELESGAAPWVKPRAATPDANTPRNAVTNRPYSGCNVVLLWMAQAAGYPTPRYLTIKQALELGGHVRKGERHTKVYFVKQLEIHEDADDSSQTRLVPLMREYSVFNVAQCDGLPDNITMGKPTRARTPDTRDDLAELNRCRHTRGSRRGVLRAKPRLHLHACIRRVQGSGSFLWRGLP